MRKLLPMLLTLSVILIHATAARADAGLLLNESMNTGSSRITSAGHSAIYLSSLCPASPVELRLCRPGEQGSILSNYSFFGEDHPFEWNIVPLSTFLYGTDSVGNAPLYASEDLRKKLELRYFQRSLTQVCAAGACDRADDNWRDMVAATFVRNVYVFEVKTSEAQDRALMEKYNTRGNISHYSGFRYNCADFSRDVINTYFPKAVRGSLINDFGVTGPKAIARSLVKYADRHPELDLRVTRLTQLPGALRRSDDCREATEALYTSKKWLVPITYLSWYTTVGFAAGYQLTGRFNPERELRRHPQDPALLQDDSSQLKETAFAPRATANTFLLPTKKQEKTAWEKYKLDFERRIAEDVQTGLLAAHSEPRQFLKELDASGQVHLDQDGSPWVKLNDEGVVRSVGLSANTLLAKNSDPLLAYRLMLANLDFTLHSKSKHRQSLEQFAASWQRMEQARDRVTHSLLLAESSDGSANGGE